MLLPDANVLIYAVNPDAAQHDRARGWLDEGLSSTEAIGFDWVVALSFLRISTHPRIFPAPLSVDEATGQLTAWMDAAPAMQVLATPRHRSVLVDLLRKARSGSNPTTDAHLAALAIEHDGAVVSFDTDFRRFPGLRWIDLGSS